MHTNTHTYTTYQQVTITNIKELTARRRLLATSISVDFSVIYMITYHHIVVIIMISLPFKLHKLKCTYVCVYGYMFDNCIHSYTDTYVIQAFMNSMHVCTLQV